MKISLFITLLSFGLSFQDFYKHEQFQELFDSFLIELELPEDFFYNTGCVEGDCDNAEGTFVLFPCIDKGDFKDGKLNGEGVRTFSNGDVISGTWIDNEIIYLINVTGKDRTLMQSYLPSFSHLKNLNQFMVLKNLHQI